MLDHQQRFIKTHFSSSNPAYQINSNCDSTGDIEFDFSGARKTEYYEHFSNLGSTEIEFQVQAQIGDGFDDYSPPLWKTNTSRHIKNESSPLLPHHHYCRNLSPRSRSKAIAEGRKELMERIQDMPETCYELSLRDIVDEQQIQQEVVLQEENVSSEEKSFHFETEVQIKKQKKKNTKAGQISRSGSMDNEIFLIKMFFPSFLGLKKKPTAGNGSKVSPSTSFEGSKNCIVKEWWKKRFLVVAGSKSRQRNSSTSRHTNGSPSQGCWAFFRTKKNKSRRQRGCIF